MKKTMNIRTDTWRNECFRKMDADPVHNTPNRLPPRMDVLPKTFLQIILADKWLGRQVRPPNSMQQTTSSISSVFFFFYGVFWMNRKKERKRWLVERKKEEEYDRKKMVGWKKGGGV